MEQALRSSTGLCSINIRFWEAEHQPPRAVLTIMHGMAEHVDRYDDFAGFLAQNGIAVAAADMASHGKSISGRSTLTFSLYPKKQKTQKKKKRNNRKQH